MNRLFAYLFAVLLLNPTYVLGQSDSKNVSDTNSVSPPVGKLVFGIMAPRGMEQAIQGWRPFTDAMTAAIQIPVELVAVKEYKELVELFKQGKIDVAWLSNLPALEIVESKKGEVFAGTVSKDGRSYYRSILIVHKDSNIQSIQDILKTNKTLVYGDGDEKSTSGRLAPLYYGFVQNKVNDLTLLFKEIKHGNFEANAIRTVLKEVDVATNNDIELGFFKNKHPELYAKLRVIWMSPNIPQSPLLWRSDLPPKLKLKISDFVIHYGKNETERNVLMQANELSGFKKASNRHLTTVADLEMFNEWRKLWNNREITATQRAALEQQLSQRSSRLEIYLREQKE